jgi:hypothetical protein
VLVFFYYGGSRGKSNKKKRDRGVKKRIRMIVLINAKKAER